MAEVPPNWLLEGYGVRVSLINTGGFFGVQIGEEPGGPGGPCLVILS